jgi:hypothetical protein
LELISIDATRSCLSYTYVSLFSVVGVAQDVTDDRRHAEELRSMQYLQASQQGKVETERNMTGTTVPSYNTKDILDISETLTVPFSISQLFSISQPISLMSYAILCMQLTVLLSQGRKN